MQKRTLARQGLRAGWTHPYATGPFDPWLYADGGDDDDSGSDKGAGDDDGGDADDDQDDDDAGGAGDDDAKDDGGKDTKPKPKPPAKKASDEAPAATIARLQKELKTANGESAKARTTAKKQAADEARNEIVQELGKALGLIKDEDAPLDPAALKAQVESATTAHRSTAIELAVYRGAGKAGVDPDAITDSRAFMASIQDLDPTDEGFAKAVTAAMKKAADDNPKLKVATAPKRTSSDFNGGAGSSSEPQTIDEIRAARRKRRTG